MDRVSTGSGSDLVSDQHAIPKRFLTPLVDQVATAPCTDPTQVRSYFYAKPTSYAINCRDIPAGILDYAVRESASIKLTRKLFNYR